MNNEIKQFHVEDGAEIWHYDLNPPQYEVLDYWVMIGEEKIFNFPHYEDAVNYANRLNVAINSVKIK
jgi:hypothetical protein